MSDYIEREKAQDGLDNIDWYHVNDKGQLLPGGKTDIETYVPFKAVEEMLKSIPAADVVPVRHGKWVKATGMMPPEYCGLHICSECGHYAGKKPPYGGREMLSDYCPYCGADMRGETIS